MEEWKDIKGYKGTYQISSLGRIKSLSRLKFCGKNIIVGTHYDEKILNGNATWKGIFGADHFMSKRVIQINKSSNIIVNKFDSIRIAEQKTGIHFSCISAVCNNGKQKTAGGFKWKFA